MDTLTPFRFILFGLACAGFVYLQFLMAHRQWLRLKGGQSSDIDLGYVRMEDCLPRNFRAKARDWLKSCGPAERVEQELFIPKGQERIRLTGPLTLDPNQDSSDILVVDGPFSCGPECRLTREIWVLGDATIGTGTCLQAIAADGALSLVEEVAVARWADSDGPMHVGTACNVAARVTSRTAVRLGHAAQVLSAYAPVVSTADWDGSMNGTGPGRDTEFLVIGAPEDARPSESALREAGVDPSKLVKLSFRCWSYLGEFRPLVPIKLEADLVVKGSCHLAGGSVLSGDVKAHGDLFVGPSSVCNGCLVSLGDICLGTGCRFGSVIHAGGSLLLGKGTRGSGKSDLVAAYASRDLFVEHDVAVAGKLASGGRVVVIGAGHAEEWRSQRTGRGA